MITQNFGLHKIREVLNEEGAFLFIGSDVSIWSGLPSWYGLVDELVDFVKNEGLSHNHIYPESLSGNLLAAAGLGRQMISAQQFKSF